MLGVIMMSVIMLSVVTVIVIVLRVTPLYFGLVALTKVSSISSFTRLGSMDGDVDK